MLAALAHGERSASVWAAALNAHRHASPVVNLTRIGGDAFGNDTSWIDGAIRRVLRVVEGVGPDMRIVGYGKPDEDPRRLVQEFP